MRWSRGQSKRRDVFWINGSYVIRRGPDNDAELMYGNTPIHRGTEDECKQEAERHAKKA